MIIITTKNTKLPILSVKSGNTIITPLQEKQFLSTQIICDLQDFTNIIVSNI